MKAVGLRELKNRLSEYVWHLRSGESVLVTDRGEVVAELGLPGRLAEQGVPNPGVHLGWRRYQPSALSFQPAGVADS